MESRQRRGDITYLPELLSTKRFGLGKSRVSGNPAAGGNAGGEDYAEPD